MKLETDVMICRRELEADSKCLQETCATIQQLETALEQCKEFINLVPKLLKKLEGQCVILFFCCKASSWAPSLKTDCLTIGSSDLFSSLVEQ